MRFVLIRRAKGWFRGTLTIQNYSHPHPNLPSVGFAPLCWDMGDYLLATESLDQCLVEFEKAEECH